MSVASPRSLRPLLRLHGRSAVLRGGLLAALVGLSGCAGGAALETFDLTQPEGAARQSPGGRQMVVAEPSALAPLQSDRIVVKGADGSISFLPGVQWSDRLPPLLQARIIQAFENAGRAVGRAGNGVSADASLQSDIRFFGVSTASGSQAMIELSARVVDAQSGRILAARVFRSAGPLGGVDGKGAAAGLDAALQRLLPDLVRWAGGASRAAAPRPAAALAEPAAAGSTGTTASAATAN